MNVILHKYPLPLAAVDWTITTRSMPGVMTFQPSDIGTAVPPIFPSATLATESILGSYFRSNWPVSTFGVILRAITLRVKEVLWLLVLTFSQYTVFVPVIGVDVGFGVLVGVSVGLDADVEDGVIVGADVGTALAVATGVDEGSGVGVVITVDVATGVNVGVGPDVGAGVAVEVGSIVGDTTGVIVETDVGYCVGVGVLCPLP